MYHWAIRNKKFFFSRCIHLLWIIATSYLHHHCNTSAASVQYQCSNGVQYQCSNSAAASLLYQYSVGAVPVQQRGAVPVQQQCYSITAAPVQHRCSTSVATGCSTSAATVLQHQCCTSTASVQYQCSITAAPLRIYVYYLFSGAVTVSANDLLRRKFKGPHHDPKLPLHTPFYIIRIPTIVFILLSSPNPSVLNHVPVTRTRTSQCMGKFLIFLS